MFSRILRWSLIAACAVAFVPTLLFAQAATAPKKTLPAFKITAARATVDVAVKRVVYQGDVQFTSPLHTTSITCQRLEANGTTTDQISAIEASGGVVCKMTMAAKDKDHGDTRIEGFGEKLRYNLTDGVPTIVMSKVNGVQPKLLMTDLKSNGAPTVITGDEITYNLNTQQIDVKMIAMENKGDAQ